MGLPHQSIATIKSPEFINLSPLDINPLMSSCEIKVFYLGKNRNDSLITKEVAKDMAKTLRGAPIVGYYQEGKEDFLDHGDQVIIDGQGIKFNCLTKPYGFVSPDAKIWFQDFDQIDENLQKITRTYLMTTGYLWTGQFTETKKILEENGRPQSMELDEKTLKGEWTFDQNNNLKFFIINDAIFSKLCILGEDIEPCFQGAAITAPEISTSFTLDQEFKNTLFNMMDELKQVLKGGYMAEEKIINETVSSEEDKNKNEEFSLEKIEENIEEPSTSFEEEKKDDAEAEDTAPEVEEVKPEVEVTEPEGATEFTETAPAPEVDTELQQKYDLLVNKCQEMEKELDELRAFKLKIDNEKKDELIAEFFMLADDDKKDVIENKEKYSLDEIKSKLAVICFEKKVNFNLNDSYKNEESMKDSKETEVVTTFDIKDQEDNIPDWVKEVELNMNGNF